MPAEAGAPRFSAALRVENAARVAGGRVCPRARPSRGYNSRIEPEELSMQNRSRLPSSVCAVAILLCSATAWAQLPDVIVGDIPSTWNWGSANGIAAFSVATTACNVGNAQMSWVGNTNQHPIIATNIFRLKAD